MQLLKRWEESTFHLLGQVIPLKVKAPSYDEAPAFLQKMAEFGRLAMVAREAHEAGTRADETGMQLFGALAPDFVREAFARNVKPGGSEPIACEGDDGSEFILKTGADVYAIANSALVMEVLAKMQAMAMLGEAEGKGSGSPATSSPATAASGSDSGATSTELEGGR